MKIEVLVATMNQDDLSKFKEMNLNSDVVFANQADRYEFVEEKINSNTVKMFTTADRGVGKNRNLAMLNATGDICLFADDDMIYENDYKSIVTEAFERIPQADIIVFNLETIGIETRKRRVNTKIKKVNYFNALNYGAARIVVRRSSIMKKNIWFSTLYGGGAKYSSGEDSLFLTEAITKGLKVYTYPKKIANVKQGESTWFEGYTHKYFHDRGVWLANAFPKLKYLLSIYYSYKMKDYTKEFSFRGIYKIINEGIQEFDLNEYKYKRGD